MWIVCTNNSISVANFNFSPLDLREKGKLCLKLKNFNSSDMSFFKVVPIPDESSKNTLEFCFVFLKQEIQLFSLVSNKRFTLILQNAANTSNDFMGESFIIGEIPEVTLHYFEYKGTEKEG
jgi:hypothetical protein